MLSLAVLLVLGQTPVGGDLFEAAVEAHRACKGTRGGPRDPASCVEAAAGYQAFLRRQLSGEQADVARFFLAELLYEEERYDEAAPLYQRVGEGSGRYAAVARYNRVLALQELAADDPAGFIAACDAFVRGDPRGKDAPVVAYAAAKRALDAGRTSEAERRLDDVLERWPASSAATFALEALLDSWCEEGAVRRLIAFSRRLRSDASMTDASLEAASRMSSLAQQLTPAHRFDEAAALLEEAALAGGNPDAMLRAALLYVDAGEADHASDALDALLARWPTSDAAGRALTFAALADARVGRTKRAQQRFEEAGALAQKPEPGVPDEAEAEDADAEPAGLDEAEAEDADVEPADSDEAEAEDADVDLSDDVVVEVVITCGVGDEADEPTGTE